MAQKKLTKDQLIDKILLQPFTVQQAIHYCKRSMIKRIGPDVNTDFIWDLDRLRFYQPQDLQEVLDELKTANNGVEVQASDLTKNQ